MVLFHAKLLHGKTILVTGASSGLGAHFAALVAEMGATVVVAARRAERLAAVAESIRSAGGECQVALLDVTDAASIEAAIASLPAIDVLINNAGIVREGACLDLAEDDWDAVIDTDLKGMFLVAQAVARRMRDQGGGAIVNIASILALRQASGVLPYAVAKSGVVQMTKTMALELARYGVRVNALAPGYLATELNEEFLRTPAGKALIRRVPQRRLGELAELDGPLLLLASPASSFMTGAIIAVDGGHLVSTL